LSFPPEEGPCFTQLFKPDIPFSHFLCDFDTVDNPFPMNNIFSTGCSIGQTGYPYLLGLALRVPGSGPVFFSWFSPLCFFGASFPPNVPAFALFKSLSSYLFWHAPFVVVFVVFDTDGAVFGPICSGPRCSFPSHPPNTSAPLPSRYSGKIQSLLSGTLVHSYQHPLGPRPPPLV